MELGNGAIILVLLTSVTAYFIKGLVGFGPSLIVVPILSIFIDFKSAVVVATLADITSSGLMFLRERKRVRIRQVAIILVGLLLGTVIGTTLFRTLSVSFLKKMFGLFIISIVLKNLILRNESAHKKFKKIIAFLVGLGGGILGGLTNSNGPPIVMYLNGIIKNKKLMRSNLSAIFITDAIWRGILFWKGGYIHSGVTSIFFFLVLPGLLVGLYLGNLSLKKLKNKTISNIIEFILLAIGGGMIFG